jgi:3',5'-cyclic AMP phosphodiesterase CpdA
VSDLHVGARRTHDDLAAGAAIVALVERVQPELVVATGDLTHLGRAGQHDAAAGFLRGLGRQLLVVPGNHDIPLTLPGRFTHTWRQFEREWETTEPVYSSASLHAIGLNSVRPWRHQSGGILAAGRRDQPAAGGTAGRLRGPRPPPVVSAQWRLRRVIARRTLSRDSSTRGRADPPATSTRQCERHEFEIVPDGAARS